MADRCQIPRCRFDADVSYLGHGVCADHWTELTSENAPPDALRMALGIAAASERENTIMPSKKKPQPAELPTAATQQTEVTAAPDPTTKATKAAKEKKVKTSKTEKAPKPQRKPRKPKVTEDLV